MATAASRAVDEGSGPPARFCQACQAGQAKGALDGHQRQGPLDDPDQAQQRIGFIDQPPLPLPTPTIAGGLPAIGRPTVVLFLRPGDAAGQCRDVSRRVASTAPLVAVLAGPASCPGAAAVLVDPDGRTAAAYGMGVPADGGPPVGYAIVDDRARIRYRACEEDRRRILNARRSR